MSNTVYLYVFDTMADWVVGYLNMKEKEKYTYVTKSF